MGREFSDMKLFWQEFRQNFQTTGAVLPSGRFLARALARYVEPSDRPRRIVEIGPGTGVVTKEILRRLGPADRLDLVELNDQFVARLRQRLEHDVAFAPFASRVRVLHLNVLDLHPDEPYDVAVSGLPLNNFSADMVETLLRSLMSLLRSGGTLSCFL
jgi:phospholipid N-methyltransferase